MKTVLGGIAFATLLASTSAGAGQLDGLKGLMGGSGGSLASASASNAAGVLQYCMSNNYLSGDSGATGVKDRLLGSLGGAGQGTSGATASGASGVLGRLGGTTAATEPTQDRGYLDGAQGILKAKDGKSLNLASAGPDTSGTGDLKAQLTRKVCDAVLKQGRKMVGMGK